jgi:NADH-quinone oxidoreductase subunit M
MNDTTLLSLIIFVPTIAALALVFFPRGSDASMKWLTLAATVITCALSFILLERFLNMREIANTGIDPITKEIRPESMTLIDRANRTKPSGARDLVVRYDWIESFRIQYFLGVDGISMSLVLLTTIICTLAMLASFSIDKYVRGYCMLFLLLETGMLGVFLALDFFLFYVFWEVVLLPMYFLIGIWGGGRREYSAIKFFLYTLAGSVLILIAILGFYFTARPPTFDMIALQEMGQLTGEHQVFSHTFQTIMFILLFIGFAIKIPIVPFHTWLPDAHVDAPTPISMILAGILLKMGGYGLIRVAYPMCPSAAIMDVMAFTVAVIGVLSIVYGALAAMAQTDFKRLVAYSSVSHMGYVTLGIAVLPIVTRVADYDQAVAYYTWGLAGAMFQMIAHGISSPGMFFLVGVIYDRAHHRDLNRFGGLMNIMPIYGGIATVIFFAGMGLPGLCGFIGEVFTVLAAFKYEPVMGIIAAAGVVLTAGYILWTVQRVFLGSSTQYEGTPDINVWPELAAVVPLVVLAVLLGVYPDSLLSWMNPDVTQLASDLREFGQSSEGLLAATVAR